MQKNDLILEVISKISDTVDGDTVLLLEQSIPTSIYRVTKQISAMKPDCHERLITSQSLSGAGISQPTGIDYPRIDLTTLPNQILVHNRLHDLTLLTNTGATNWRGYPTESIHTLGLASVHNRLMYYIEYPFLYLGYPSGIPDVNTLTVRHYTFMDISNFPVELKDYLIDDLLNVLQLEAQKQAVENAQT